MERKVYTITDLFQMAIVTVPLQYFRFENEGMTLKTKCLGAKWRDCITFEKAIRRFLHIFFYYLYFKRFPRS